MRRRRVTNLEAAWSTQGYRFIDKDPMIDLVCHLIEKDGRKYSELAEKSGVAATTMRNWDKGKTRRPQNITIRAVLRTVGYDIGVHRIAKGDNKKNE